jgi:type II secretory pathway component GspD/PulD (secretin)
MRIRIGRFLRVTLTGVLSAGVLACSAGSALAQISPQNLVVEVISLRYRTAQELIPILQPMVAREGSLSGLQSQLIVRTTPANLEDIKRILASVDVMPRQLLITVRQDADITNERSGATVSGSVGGEHGRITVPGSPNTRGGNVVLREGDNRARVHVIEGRSNEVDRNAQSVRVMEGREAFVRIGQSVPVRGREVRRTMVGGQVVEQVVDTTHYRDMSTGFYVLPRVSGDRVTLDISPQRETPSHQVPGAVSVQGVVTTVSGQLGDWIEIGGIGQDSSGQRTVLLGQSASSTRDVRRVQVRVEEAR